MVGHIRASHVGLLMSAPAELAEGCPNSIMEYMACGLPVVCTDSGGNREVVLEGRTGLIVPPLDPSAVVNALRILAQDPETARRFGQAGRERIRTAFSTREMVAKTVSVYESVLRERGDVPA